MILKWVCLRWLRVVVIDMSDTHNIVRYMEVDDDRNHVEQEDLHEVKMWDIDDNIEKNI